MTTVRPQLERCAVIRAVSNIQYAICACTNGYLLFEKPLLQSITAVILCRDTLT